MYIDSSYIIFQKMILYHNYRDRNTCNLFLMSLEWFLIGGKFHLRCIVHKLHILTCISMITCQRDVIAHIHSYLESFNVTFYKFMSVKKNKANVFILQLLAYYNKTHLFLLCSVGSSPIRFIRWNLGSITRT